MLKKKPAAPPPAPVPSPAVRVPKPVLDGINAVRESGRGNMLNLSRVVHALKHLGHLDAALWVRTHPSDYHDGLLHGFERE